jgi:hypothetical protein
VVHAGGAAAVREGGLRAVVAANSFARHPPAPQPADTAPARRVARTPAGAHLGQLRPRPRAPHPVPLPATRDTLAAPPADTAPAGFAFQASVQPKTVTVGDRFVSGAAVAVPAGTRVAVEVPKDSADRWRVVGTATATARDSARTRWLVVAPMVAWVPGIPDTLHARLRLTPPGGRTLTIPVTLRLPTVRAVLPDDTTKWRVRPPHDVWGPSRDWRALGGMALLALLLLALVAWLAARLVRRRRKQRVPATARQRALALLEKARTSGFIEAGNWKAFYTVVGDALRGFAAELEPRWSTDLTTSELMEAMREGSAAPADVDALGRLLRIADLAKFARHGRDLDDARRDLDEARRWVEGFAPPARAADGAEAAPEAVGAAP